MVVNVAATVKSDLTVKTNLTLPLLHVVESDDVALEQNSDAEWFLRLRYFRWQEYRALAGAYYEALLDFNNKAAKQRGEREACSSSESKEEARVRLLFDRPTMEAEEAAMLFEPPAPQESITIEPETLAPGVVPLRYAGRQPKDFFSLFKAFVGVVMMGRPPEPEEVHHHLVNNPSFARGCGFTQPKPNGLYRSSDIPSLRKIEQFDQIMTAYGLWDRCKWDEVKKSLAEEAIQPERELVHDTTHFLAASSFETVEWEDEQGKTKRKSQSKVTSNSQSSRPAGVKTKSSVPIPSSCAMTALARSSRAPGRCTGLTKPPSSPSRVRESLWTWSP